MEFPISTDLECNAGKVASSNEGHTWTEDGGDDDVADLFGASEALVRAVPGTIDAANALWFSNDIIPLNLFQKIIMNHIMYLLKVLT